MSWNAKAGVNVSNITELDAADTKLGYQLGVGLDYYFTKHWGVQSSLMFINKGYKLKGDYNYPIGESAPEKSYDLKVTRGYLEIPLMLAYRINLSKNDKLVLNGGGYMSYGISGHYINTETLEDGTKKENKVSSFTNGMEKFDAGLCAGVSYEYKKYFIGVFADLGLTKTESITKNKTLGLNIGYKF